MALKAFLFSDFRYCDPGYEVGWSDVPFQVHQYVHWYDEHPDIRALKTADHAQISLKNRNGQQICLDFDIAP